MGEDEKSWKEKKEEEREGGKEDADTADKWGWIAMTLQHHSPGRHCIGLDDWPQQDRRRWQTAMSSADPFDSAAAVIRAWRGVTRLKIEGDYGRWLGWLASIGALDENASPATRATPAHLTSYLVMLRSHYADYTASGRVQSVGDALRVLAPDVDWRWIHRAAQRVHSRARPARPATDRLRPAEDVLGLGLGLMKAAQWGVGLPSPTRAIMFRDGLAIALMVYRPLRIRTMSLIQLGKNLHSAGTWRLSFDSSEMKTGRPIDIPFPSEMTSHLETYLVEYRPLLVGGRTSKALWVSTTGEQMSEAVLAHRIKKRTRDEFGTAINPHAFRHLVATTIATYDPENATGIAAILGHASLETSERYYNLAKSVHASERFNETITDLRRRLQL